MKNLSDLTPAETLLVTTGKAVPVKDLLKVTFMDLLLKRSLRTTEVENGKNEQGAYSNTYVTTGENFSYSKSLEHEKVFLRQFYNEEKREVLFTNAVKLAYNYAGSEKKYNKLIRDSAGLSGCFSSGLSRLFNPFELTDYGLEVSASLKSQLSQLSDTLPDLMQNDQQKSLEILKHIKGNIFLVKGIDFKRMAEIEKAVNEEVYSNYSSPNSVMSDPMTWIFLDLHSSRFDSSCSGCSSSDFSDSDSVSGESGCSGSGCSGCGGGD